MQKISILKGVLIFSLLGLTSVCQSAKAPGANVSRANCWAPFLH